MTNNKPEKNILGFVGRLPGAKGLLPNNLKEKNFILIEIFANPKTRYERLIKRGENSDDNNKTYEEFLEDHKRSTEMSIPEVAKNATEKIDNNGSIEDLHQQLDNLVKKYAS